MGHSPALAKKSVGRSSLMCVRTAALADGLRHVKGPLQNGILQPIASYISSGVRITVPSLGT